MIHSTHSSSTPSFLLPISNVGLQCHLKGTMSEVLSPNTDRTRQSGGSKVNGRRLSWAMWGSVLKLRWSRLCTFELKAEEVLNRALWRTVGWKRYVMVPGLYKWEALVFVIVMEGLLRLTFASLATLWMENSIFFLTRGLYDNSIQELYPENFKSNLWTFELLKVAACLCFVFCNSVSHNVQWSQNTWMNWTDLCHSN